MMIDQKVIDFLNEYTGTNNFINSIKRQYDRYNRLSEKQVSAMLNIIDKPVKPKVFTYEKGQEIQIKNWLARALAKKKNIPVFFRNLKIENITNETPKAIQVDVSFISHVSRSCHFCGKGLDHEVSRATGVGPVCAKKYLGIKNPNVDKAQEILDRLDEEAKVAGVIKEIWIPKSQIVTEMAKVLFGEKAFKSNYIPKDENDGN